MKSEGFSQWQIMYNQHQAQISFRMASGQPGGMSGTLNLKDLNFSCKESVKIIELTKNSKVDLSKSLVNYSKDKNKEMIVKSVAGTQFEGNRAVIELVASYPETTRCLEK